MIRNTFLFIITCFLFASGCKQRSSTDKPDVDIDVKRLDKDLFSDESVNTLKEKFGDFFDLYTEDIIGIGNSSDPDFETNLIAFKTFETVEKALEKVSKTYPDSDDLNQKLTKAFALYKHYFPDKQIPKIYSYIAARFDISLIVRDDVLAIGLDNYLSDTEFYSMLGVPKYISANKTKEKILPDCIHWLLVENFPYDDRTDNLISRMIYQGKIIYLTKLILPDVSDNVITGFSDEQMKWCENNEGNMWMHLIENKLLFETDRFTLVKLTEDAPSTSMFPSESPGRACLWIGYRIVDNYMKNNKNISIAELMRNTDALNITEKAKYKPR